MVLPFLCISLASSMTSLEPCSSKPAVGSSNTKISGLIAKIPAIATRRLSPPESSNGDFL